MILVAIILLFGVIMRNVLHCSKGIYFIETFLVDSDTKLLYYRLLTMPLALWCQIYLNWKIWISEAVSR